MHNDHQPFTPLFQREMLVLLLQDPEAYGKYRDVWTASYWDDVNHRKIVEAFLRARAGAKEHPTKTTIIQEVLDGIDNVRGILPMDKVAQLDEVEVLYNAPLPSPGNANYGLKRVARFAKNQAIVAALGSMIEKVHIGDPDGTASIFANASRVGSLNEEDGLESAEDLASATIDESQNILGNRLLERGTFGVIIGHSGAGKSTLTVQAGVELAAGHPILGIVPARPLKVLVVQAEDSRNDRIDQMRCLPVLVTDEEERKTVYSNFRMYSTTRRGEDLFTKLKEINDEQKIPFDLFILNPAFAFLQDDASAEESADVGHFLRKQLLPFLQETGATCIIMHHPPKINNRDTSKWTVAMWQYSAHGSAEWTNAPRFSMSIEQTASPTVFQFIIGKRGSRSGWQRDETGKFARYFKYADPGEPMHWKEATEDDIEDAQQNDDVKIADIVAVFKNEPRLSLPQIRDALREDGFKVDNDWLLKKLEHSPKFRREGNFFMLEKNARQEEKEEKSEQILEMKDLAREKVFSAIETAGEINVNQLSEKTGIRKETLSVHLEKLEDAGRIECHDGHRNAKLYSVKTTGTGR
jgi:DNA-binding transcriptional ArsR family regulator